MSRKLHEMNHVVYSGWMIKSPPERKLTGPWKIFRSKWKRRYFVLSKPAQSLPGTYLLNYFSDENCRRQKGYIDLEQCAEIIESLDSDQFQYLLAIKTTHKGRERKYFLATETEEQMSTWVRTLCSVCGLKADDTEPTPEPHARPVQPAVQTQPSLATTVSPQGIMAIPSISTTSPSNMSPSTAHSPPRNSPNTSSHSQPTPHKVPSRPKHPPGKLPADLEEYIPLETCTSGSSIKKPGRQVSVDSVPDELAPAPPSKVGSHDFNNDVFHSRNNVDSAYDIPPPSNMISEDDVYKVPPPRPTRETIETYDYPPTHPSPGTPRSSSGESQKADSAYSSQSMYDTPPSRTDTTLTQDDTYDIPPSHDEPPGRPPKPGCLSTNVPVQEPYMNLPPTSRVFSEMRKDINAVVKPPTSGMTQITQDDMYDIPPSAKDSNQNLKSTDGNDNLSAMVPPPSMCAPKERRYINTYNVGPADQDVYLPMDPFANLPPAVPPVAPRHSSSTDNEVEYTDMSGRSEFNDSFEGKQALYDFPRPSQDTPPPPVPNRPRGSDKLISGDSYSSVFSTARTKSFKRNNQISPVVKRKPETETIQLPTKADSHPDYSTSDEDDEEMGTPNMWQTKPPAPPTGNDTELKYVDLDHNESSDKEPVRSPHAATAPLQTTEYHEIDFVKTDALRNVKETVSEERNKKSNDT